MSQGRHFAGGVRGGPDMCGVVALTDARVRRWWSWPAGPRGRTVRGGRACCSARSRGVGPRLAGRCLGWGCARCRGRTLCSRTAFSSRSLGFERSDLGEKYVPGGHRSPRCGRLAPDAGVRRGLVVARGRGWTYCCGCMTVACIWPSGLARIEAWSTRGTVAVRQVQLVGLGWIRVT